MTVFTAQPGLDAEMSNLHGRQRAPPSGVTSNFKGLLKGWPQLEPGRFALSGSPKVEIHCWTRDHSVTIRGQ